MLERTYRIADIYKSVEQEAYNILGQTVILVRFVFPKGLKHSHLLPEREVPAEDYTISEVLDQIRSYGPSLPVHFIEDDPVLCGVEHLLQPLYSDGRKLHLNTCGFFPLSVDALQNLTSLYIQTKPGLFPFPLALDWATEIRAYWKPGDKDYTDHVHNLQDSLPTSYRQKTYLVPYNVDEATIRETLEKAMALEWNFGLRLSSVAPNSDKFLQNRPEAEDVYHARFKEALGLATKPRAFVSRQQTSDPWKTRWCFEHNTHEYETDDVPGHMYIKPKV